MLEDIPWILDLFNHVYSAALFMKCRMEVLAMISLEINTTRPSWYILRYPEIIS
jgi:hypothetical protein